MAVQQLRPVSARRHMPFLRELGTVLAAYFAYFAVRGATEGDRTLAVEHAQLVQRFEQALGFFWEPRIQSALLDHEWIVNLANWVYIWGHWPVIAAVALWLYRSQPDRYRLTRNALLVSGGIGLVIFTAFPVAPPRLAEMGLVDTVVQRSNFYHVLQPPALTNQYAALPSLHFGWNLLIGIALVRGATHPTAKALGVLLPLAMFAAVVVTANHYLIDTVAGGTIALIGLRAAVVLRSSEAPERRLVRRVVNRIRGDRDAGVAWDGSAVSADATEQRPLRRLVVEQPGLAIEAAPVASQGAIGANHPVTGNDDRYRIAVVGPTDGTRGARLPDRVRDIAVAGGHPRWDVAQRPPDLELKWRAARVDGEVEIDPLPGEVLLELADRLS